MRALSGGAHRLAQCPFQCVSRSINSSKKGRICHDFPFRHATRRSLTVLALESSADDSCCAIVDSNRKILANVVIKQHLLNAKYGGIHPLRAAEGHAAGVPLAIGQALLEAQITLDDVDAVAYTRGPGIHPCLSVGASAAKALAAANRKPVYGIHHMSHSLTPLLTEQSPPRFPCLVLLISGGHTQLVHAKGLSEFHILARTLDNSIGDIFDKVARALNIPASSDRNPGALLEEQAALTPLPPYDAIPLPKFPVPLASVGDPERRDAAFSFAGLYSHSVRVIAEERERGMDEHAIMREVARRFQEAAVGHLLQQIRRVLIRAPSRKKATTVPDASINTTDIGESGAPVGEVTGIVASGGVASNMYLRQQLQSMVASLPSKQEIKLYYPPVALCTDNAAMIAWTAILRIQARAEPEGYDLPIRPKWSLEDLYDDLS